MARRTGRGGGAQRVALAVVLLLAAGCAQDVEQPEGLDTEGFIDVIVALREAENEVAGTDSAIDAFEERKREVFERHGTSEAELYAFLDRQGRDTRFLAELWDTLSARLRRPIIPDSVAEGRRSDDGEAVSPDDSAVEAATPPGDSALATGDSARALRQLATPPADTTRDSTHMGRIRRLIEPPDTSRD